jgi:hypothetical protein
MDVDMNESDGGNAQHDISESIAALLKENAYVSYVDFERVLEEGEEDIPVKQMDEALKFISNQSGLWQAEYFFSPEHSPDENAKQEMDGWGLLWEGCSKAFADYLPDGIDMITRRHNIMVALPSTERRVEFNKNKTFERILTSVFSKSALWINKLGLYSLAVSLMNASMFPKGTVGRS